MLDLFTTLLVIGLLVSLNLNIFMLFRERSLKKARKESYEVKELLHDLTGGHALVEIRRVSPTDVFLRSPRTL